MWYHVSVPNAATQSNSGTRKLGPWDVRVERDWARLGVLFNCRASRRTPDLERLLLDTARACPDNARLLPLVVTWLSQYGQFVARHRLKRLVQTELEPEHSSILGLIVEEAITAGGTRELLIVSEVCEPRRPAGPLARARRAEASLVEVAKRQASEASARWGAWAPPIEPKPDAIRSVSWLLEHNPELRERIVRKGDLRVSIIETLRRDAPGGTVSSEVALANLSGATRAAVRKALGALCLEGVVSVGAMPENGREHRVTLLSGAVPDTAACISDGSLLKPPSEGRVPQ